MTSFRATTTAILFLVAVSQHLSPSIGFLFPDLKLHPDTRSAGIGTPRYRVAAIQQEPYLFANGSGYVPDLMRHLAQSFRTQNNGDELVYEIVAVASWSELMSKARASHTLAFDMVIPSLELTNWSSRQLRSSVPALYTTLKLVVPKRKVNEWSSNGDSASTINRVEEVESVASHGGSAQLTDRVKVVLLRGSPAEYLLSHVNGYRGPVHLVENTDEAVNILLNSSEESTLLTDAVIADHIASKYSNEMESICPSRLTGSGWIYYAFFGRDEAVINKFNAALSSLMTDETLVGLYSRHFIGQFTKRALQQCPW